LAAELGFAPRADPSRAETKNDLTTSPSTHAPVPAPPVEKRAPKAVFRYLWVVYVMFGITLLISYFWFPASAPPASLALGLSSVMATLVGVRRYRPRQPAAWYLLAAAALCFCGGDTSLSVMTLMMSDGLPFPSVADLFYLLSYPFFAGGIFLVIRARSSSRDIPSLIDAVIITTGLSLLSWVYLIVPNYQAGGLDALQRITSVAYPLGDVLILAMLTRLVAGGGLAIRSMQLLMTGAIGLMGADVLYGLIRLNGVWHVGTAVDAGWAIFYVAWGAAALHPSMRQLSEVVPLSAASASRLRITVLACASLIAPTVLLVQSQRHKDINATTVAIFSAALFILVLTRMSGILTAHQQSVRREQALRSSTEALVAAQGLPDIYQAALAGVTSLVGAARIKDASVYLSETDTVRCVASSSTSRPLRDERAFWDAAQAGGYLSDGGTVSVNPLRYELTDRGMLITEGKTALSVDQHQSLATLASQVALAVVSATLAEQLRQRHSQEQFTGMIQNASDLIVMVDEHGRLTYGTPSMERELGHSVADLLGTPMTSLLHPDDAVMAEALISGGTGRGSQAPTVADWRLRHADGRYLFFEVVTSNLLDNPSVAAIILTMRDVTGRRGLEQQLMHQAFHDTLTGLPNRALFQDRAEHALARAARNGTMIAMAMLDLDDFKVINDTRGHSAGDTLLTEVARRLQMTLRSTTTIARLGGDEFAILIEDLDAASQAKILTERTLEPFRMPFIIDGEEVVVTASVGVVLSGGSEIALTFTELLRCADLALYAAKEHGKGRAEIYHDELHTRMVNRLNQRAELSEAMATNQFELHFQPIVLIETGQIVGSEALIRWRHPTRGLVMPGEFIMLAEETGQIVELGRWVLDHACRQWRIWADQGHGDHRISVNVSARQLQQTGFADEVRIALQHHDMTPSALILELTESVFALDDGSTLLHQLTTIRDMGVHIAVDDFGTGYSSLSYLQQFQIHELKVDKSFVDTLGTGNPNNGALTDAIVSMAHSLKLDVVAEGIEKAAQRDELSSMGCGLGQGYLYSKPLPPEELLDLLNEAKPLGSPTTSPHRPRTARPRRAPSVTPMGPGPAD
jgi:diguanylate cyclase (GGDEF)-like protein/PAS domain S-box-containing protein